jgi:hypothetical protein
MSQRFTRYLIGAGAALALGLAAAPAHASTTISLKDSQENTSWDAYSHEDCPADNTAWLWHFVLPGGEATFDSLTVEFQNAGEVVKTSDWAQDGKGAYITVAGADTVLSATAEIEGSTPQGDFVISHTCEGQTGGTTGGTTGETTGTTTGETTTGGTTGTTTGETSGGTTGTTTTTGGGGGGGATSTTGGSGGLGGSGVVLTPQQPSQGGGLPFTGQNTLQLVAWAFGALAAGTALLVVARGRKHSHR